MQLPVCEVLDCQNEATRVEAAHYFCAQHHLGHLAEDVPLTRCEVCGEPTPNPAEACCMGHKNWTGPIAA
jgi:hypothetical protein